MLDYSLVYNSNPDTRSTILKRRRRKNKKIQLTSSPKTLKNTKYSNVMKNFQMVDLYFDTKKNK